MKWFWLAPEFPRQNRLENSVTELVVTKWILQEKKDTEFLPFQVEGSTVGYVHQR
jgi:hypothetical protein